MIYITEAFCVWIFLKRREGKLITKKRIDSFTRAVADITEPEKRSLLYTVLIGVINEYKNGRYDDMDGIEILNSFGIKCKLISVSATEENEKKNKKKTKEKTG